MRLAPAPVPIAYGEGAWLVAESGKRYLDAISSWWVTLHGHAHPHIAAAIAQQAGTLEQVIFAGFTHRPAAQLAGKLAALLPAGLNRVFYSDNGSTAVEVSLKMAVQYWANQDRPQRHRIVALRDAYHGDTVATMSVSEPSYFTEKFQPLMFPVQRARTAPCACCGAHANDCDSLEAILQRSGEEVAAVIVEPLLQGAGGMKVHPATFLRDVRRLCDRYGALMIADEVLTGFGRTGIERQGVPTRGDAPNPPLFACEASGIVPDIICLSKGLTGGFLPMAATACTARVFQAFYSENRRDTFFHGHSYTANPLGCAAALASLEVFEREPVFERIARITQIHSERLEAIRKRFADRVLETRQAGTVGILELRDESGGYLAAVGPKLQNYFLENGVLLRPLGSIIYCLPPYCISEDELNQVWDLVERSLQLA